MKKQMMLYLLIGFAVCFNRIHAQTQEKEGGVFLLVENLSVDSYAEWFKSLDKPTQSSLVYVCIPAQIIGINNNKMEEVKKAINLKFKVIEELSTSRTDAEERCSTFRGNN